jgi:hypothetical protein
VETSAKKLENVEKVFYNVVRLLRLGELPEGGKHPQRELGGLGVTTKESIAWSNFRTWKWLLLLYSGYERRK